MKTDGNVIYGEFSKPEPSMVKVELKSTILYVDENCVLIRVNSKFGNHEFTHHIFADHEQTVVN